MKAWGYKVLENETVYNKLLFANIYEDEPFCVDDMGESKKDINLYVANLLDEENADLLLLGIELVDVSINGVNPDILGDNYILDYYLKEIQKHPLEGFVEKALTKLETVRELDKLAGWFNPDKRKELLDIIEQRLKGEKYNYQEEKRLWFTTYLNYNNNSIVHAISAFKSNGYDNENQDSAKKMHIGSMHLIRMYKDARKENNYKELANRYIQQGMINLIKDFGDYKGYTTLVYVNPDLSEKELVKICQIMESDKRIKSVNILDNTSVVEFEL